MYPIVHNRPCYYDKTMMKKINKKKIIFSSVISWITQRKCLPYNFHIFNAVNDKNVITQTQWIRCYILTVNYICNKKYSVWYMSIDVYFYVSNYFKCVKMTKCDRNLLKCQMNSILDFTRYLSVIFLYWFL